MGNLLTGARLGLGGRVGWNLAPPFLPTATAADYGVAVVAEWQIGISARLKQATFSYIVHQTGAEYTTRMTAHQWSSLQAAWEFGR